MAEHSCWSDFEFVYNRIKFFDGSSDTAAEIKAALVQYPEWVCMVVDGHKWTMLHQLALSGNVPLLRSILETNIPSLRLEHLTKDGKSLVEVAQGDAMKAYCKKIVDTDAVSNMAKFFLYQNDHFERIEQFAAKNPESVWEIPIQRDFSIAMQVAFSGTDEMMRRILDKTKPSREQMATPTRLNPNKTIFTVAQERFGSYPKMQQTLDQYLREGPEPERKDVVPDEVKKEQPKELECVMCYENPRTHAFVPCGHKCACYECGDKIMQSTKKCPMCNTAASMQMKIFCDS